MISLAAGEPDLATPEVVIKAAQRALEAGATRYTPVKGIPELCAAIADDSKRARQVACDPEREVIVTVGAKQALIVAPMLLGPIEYVRAAGFRIAKLDPAGEWECLLDRIYHLKQMSARPGPRDGFE